MLSQSSGLHEYLGLKEIAGWGPNEVFTQADALQLIRQQKQLDYVPGTKFSRTHTGLVLLAEVVQKVTQQSIADYTKEHIFEPLQMTNTQFCEDYESIIPNAAVSYQATKDGYKKRGIINAVVGPTNLYISAADMCRWYLNFKHPKVGSAGLIKKMTSPVTLNDGRTYNTTSGEFLCGQQFEHPERGIPKYWNYGLAGGYASNIFIFPGQELTSFVIGNNNRYNGMPAMQMAFETLGDVFPEPPSIDFSKVKTIKLSSKELAKHEGYYLDEDAGYGRRIYVKNDTLRYGRLGSERENALVPLSPNTFQMVVGSDDKLIFTFDKKEGQKRMLLNVGGSDPLVYTAYEPAEYTPTALTQFTGTFYSTDLNTTYTFSVKDEQLVASHFRKNDIRFTPLKKDLFSGSAWYFGTIQFERNEQGDITGFSVGFDGIKNLKFEKVVKVHQREDKAG